MAHVERGRRSIEVKEKEERPSLPPSPTFEKERKKKIKDTSPISRKNK
jgi:hypothetical protein